MKIISADYVLPISAEPITDGAVAIDGGKIVSVGKRDEIVAQYPEANHENFGKAAILPGFVNCHSHLELTAMRGALDDVEYDFRSWLLRVNDLRAKMSDAEIEAAAIAGAMEGARAGVTCFGDIGRYGKAGFEALKKVGLRGVLFQETEFSPDNRTADEDIEQLKEKFFALNETATDFVEVGLSPHSPYTVSPRLFEHIAEFATAENIKITIHAAESADERSLLVNGDGFFIEVYKKFGLEWNSPRCSSLEFLESTGILKTKPLLAHCVTVSDSDIELIRSSGSSIAHCPKSNAKFGHGYAPFEKFLDAEISVGLGSDSVASNNVCDLLEESRFAALAARNRPGSNRFISPREVLEAATLGGAKALGLDHLIGTLESGKQADMTVVSLGNAAQQPINEIHAALVFSSNARDIVVTMVAGTTVYNSRLPNANFSAIAD
jgi:cytosine/adenosine deaminase-related metal-dependent hydrolase